jgi:cytochrome P450
MRAAEDAPEFALNMFDPAVRRDPYPHYAAMRSLGPLVKNAMTGFWMVWRYEDVQTVLNDHATFSSEALRGGVDRPDAFGAPTMLNSDPPDHDRYRSVVQRAFTPRAIAALEPRLRDVASTLLVDLSGDIPFDIVEGLAGPLPVIAIAEMLGVNAADRAAFREWSDDLLAQGDFPTAEEAVRIAEAGENLRSYFAREIENRAGAGRDDLVARLVDANADNVLSDAELLASCVLLLVAGNETTTNLITNITLQLGRHPDQRDLLLADPSAIPSAIEETLRFDGPVHWTIRVPTKPVELGGYAINPGEPILVVVAAANRDPAVFPDPDRYDVSRTGNRHIGFGHGTHFCLGAALARLETRLAVEALLENGGRYALAEPDGQLDYPRFNLRSPSYLPIIARPREGHRR